MFWKKFILLGLAGLLLWGWVLYDDINLNASREQSEQQARDLADLSVLPVISDRMRDPSWTISYWMGVDTRNSACETADDLMDQNAISKTTTRRWRRGRTSRSTISLADSIEGCRGRDERELSRVEPYARKWCAYRDTDMRLETLCREWEQNRNRYAEQIRATDEPTLARYERFIAGSR